MRKMTRKKYADYAKDQEKAGMTEAPARSVEDRG